MTHILLVEDNVDLAYGLQNNLEIEGYEVTVAVDARSALSHVANIHPAIIILDLMLPGMDGFQFLQELRRSGSTAPVLILTARGEEGDKVRGLKLGADDYVTKPFGVMELLARVEAILRRTGARPSHPRPGAFTIGHLRIEPDHRRITAGASEVPLTPKEFDLVLALCSRRGKVASRADLMREVWGYHESVVSRTVDTHIAEVRRKIELDPATPTYILTVRSRGYRIGVPIKED